MNPLLRLERWLDASITGAFARLFRSPIDPVEISAAIQRECDDKAIQIGGGRILVPNEFAIEISREDFGRVDSDSLRRELVQAIDRYAVERNFSFAGPVTVSILSEATIESGLYALRSTSLAVVPKEGEGEIYLEVGTRKIALKSGVFRIGRDDSMDLRLEDPGVSRHHCDIEINGSLITVLDHNSTNGTLVNGVAISRGTLADGSRLRVGGTDLIIHTGGAK